MTSHYKSTEFPVGLSDPFSLPYLVRPSRFRTLIPHPSLQPMSETLHIRSSILRYRFPSLYLCPLPPTSTSLTQPSFLEFRCIILLILSVGLFSLLLTSYLIMSQQSTFPTYTFSWGFYVFLKLLVSSVCSGRT